MDDVGLGGQLVGAGGIADSPQGAVLLLTVHAHHQHGASADGAEDERG